MKYMEDFLSEYKVYMDDDYKTILHILSLVPYSYVYIFTMNLLKHRDELYAGDVVEGERREGYIYYMNRKIILELNGEIIILLKLPEAYDI